MECPAGQVPTGVGGSGSPAVLFNSSSLTALSGRRARRTILLTGATAALTVFGATGAVAATPGKRPAAGQLDAAGLPVEPTRTQPFSIVGVTWDDPGRSLSGAVQVRTRDSGNGQWRPWQTLAGLHHGPDATSGEQGRGGREPLWAGPSDGVQFRAAETARALNLPGGMALACLDPKATASTAAAPTPVRPGRAGQASRPALVDRAGWGANENLVFDPPQYMADAKAVFVHHTAGGNDYGPSDSPAIVRGVFLYHVQELGWNDVGYNLFVDKYGTLFEGRAGGIERAVRAAHTYGFNTDTSSIALLGNTEDAGVGTAVKSSIAQLAGWKLRHHGHGPTARSPSRPPRTAATSSVTPGSSGR
ncbi:N-acetylmuramoyl-L-alanine amidase [Streptomyces sp. IBSNAI002]|uniref:N-acetylmuramoyl-L-alanine amidase n=1 Tax=Streptomyces sp. IBSNAI002 TaxID=3457500 RepID=UPI003FD15012